MREVKQVKRVKMTITVTPKTRASLLRLNAASGTSISRLIEEFLSSEVLDSISEGLEQARAGQGLKAVSSTMSAVVGRHIVTANEILSDFKAMGNDK